MKGFIKVETTERDGQEGLSTEVHLENVSPVDRCYIMHSVCYALHMQPWEVMMFADMYRNGVFSKPEVTHSDNISVDVMGILRELFGGVLSNAC